MCYTSYQLSKKKEKKNRKEKREKKKMNTIIKKTENQYNGLPQYIILLNGEMIGKVKKTEKNKWASYDKKGFRIYYHHTTKKSAIDCVEKVFINNK